MPNYKAHGLSVKSQITFPELLEGPKEFDVIIKYAEINYSSKKIISEGVFRISSHYILTEESVFLVWNNIDICEIKCDEILINPKTNIEESFLRSMILGPAMGILLHLRGRLVLHASAVLINNVAVAFMGDNGVGKSTTTTSFLSSGYPLITDDIMSVEFINEVPYVFPGFPRIKLWPESIPPMMNSFIIHPELRKKSCQVDNFFDEYVVLKEVFIIKNSAEKTSVVPMSPQKSLIELIKNSYCANIFQDSDQATGLGEYGKIVKQVSIKKLLIKKDLDKIPEMVHIVEKDIF